MLLLPQKPGPDEQQGQVTTWGSPWPGLWSWRQAAVEPPQAQEQMGPSGLEHKAPALPEVLPLAENGQTDTIRRMP